MENVTKDTSGGLGSPAGSPAASPAAKRAVRTGWKDPRLWVGVVLVAASVLLGARVFAAADDTVEVWAAGVDLRVGEEPSADDLRAVRVHFADGDDARAYLKVVDGDPAGVVQRSVAAGELLPAAALGEPRDPTTTISVEVASARVPPATAAGSVVDVWITPPEAGLEAAQDRDQARTRRLLQEVTVLEAPRPADGFGGVSGTRQVVLALAAETAEADLQQLIDAASDGRVVLSGRG